jgi:hypothetical protein
VSFGSNPISFLIVLLIILSSSTLNGKPKKLNILIQTWELISSGKTIRRVKYPSKLALNSLLIAYV